MSNFKLHKVKGFFIHPGICGLGLSLEAQGLYLNIRRLAGVPGWDFSVNKLATALKQKTSAIEAGLKELEGVGLLERGSVWHIYEEPHIEGLSDHTPETPGRAEEGPEPMGATRRQISIYEAFPDLRGEPVTGSTLADPEQRLDGGLRSSS